MKLVFQVQFLLMFVRSTTCADILVGAEYNKKLQGNELRWTLRSMSPTRSFRIQLFFVEFFVSQNDSCNSTRGPYIKVRSFGVRPKGRFMTSPTPLKTKREYVLCGSHKQLKERVWIMDAMTVQITFRHLGSAEAKLFLMYRYVFSLIPAYYCFHKKTGNSGVFKTTRRRSYTNLAHCSAQLSVTRGEKMVITLKYVKLEYSGESCVYDRLIIYDGPSENSAVLGRYCGLLEDVLLYPNSDRVLVMFQSDNTGTTKGFRLLYTIANPSTILKTMQGVIKLPVQTEGAINCITGLSCTLSFQRSDHAIFVWEISVPIGHDVAVTWNMSAHSQIKVGGSETEYQLHIYGGTYSEKKKGVSSNVRVFAGRQSFITSLLTVQLSVSAGDRVSTNISYQSLYHIDRVPEECKNPGDTQVVVTFANTKVALTEPKQDVNCVWVFRASNKYNFVKLKIDKMTYVDNDCDALGYAVYDGNAPNAEYKLRGPFCRASDPTTIFSTQEFMTVVFYVRGNTNKLSINAFVSETDCIPVYSDSTIGIDVSRRPCIVLLDFPQQNDNTTIQKSFPIKNLKKSSQVQLISDLSQAIKCHTKTDCFRIYSQPAPLLPTCNYKLLKKIPELIFACPGKKKPTQLAFKVQNVANPLSQQCVELLCSENTYVTSRTCGRFSLLKQKNIATGVCRLLLHWTHHRCKRPGGSHEFFHYRLRFTANNANIYPSVKERIFANPCGGQYSEHLYLIDKEFSGRHVVYTVSSDHVEITVARKYPFTLEFELIKIDPPSIERLGTDCLSGNYFQTNGKCYTLRQFQFDAPPTWNYAQMQCEKDGAHLVSIGNERELIFLKQMLATYWRNTAFLTPNLLIYIGLIGEGGNGSWTDGTQLRFTEWHTRLYSDKTSAEESNFKPHEEIAAIISINRLQPIRQIFSLCTVMYISERSVRSQHKTHWAKLPCNYPFSNALYICKKASKSSHRSARNSDATITYQHRCPEKWTFMKGRCLKMVTSLQSLATSLSYAGAKAICLEKEARVASIGDNDKDAIMYLLSLWKHQPEYRGIWLKKVNTTCRIINPRKNIWKTLVLKLDAINENVVEYEFVEFDCDTEPPFILSTTPLRHPFRSNIQSDAWQERKTSFPNGPLSVLCERDVVNRSLRCGAHQHTCQDGTCIFEAQLCDGNLDCLGGDDEETCGCENAFRCQSGECLPYSLYCDHVNHCKDGSDEADCTYPSCSTGEFRCADGTCIAMNRTCDLVKDCRAGDDEGPAQCNGVGFCSNGFRCYSATCIPKSRQNDLQPDCPTCTAEDELLKYVDSVKGEVNTGTATKPIITVNYKPFCTRDDEVRCIPHYPRCFRRETACVYNVDKYVNPVVDGCRDFSHLKNCSRFQCPGMFKCPGSFCIHVRRVCDGSEDCVNGEDEVNCEQYKCPGLLRCPGQRYCIEQKSVCNGQVDCPNGDDEKYCDISEYCPGPCTCNGLSMSCNKANLSSIPTYSKSLRALLFSSNSLELYSNTFEGYQHLGVLDISHNNITRIPQGSFQGLNNLLLLNLTGNQITHLREYTFRGVNIKHLDLSRNKLISIFANAFVGRLNILNIELNDRNLKIDIDAFVNVQMDFLTTDAYRYCCDLKNNVKCLPEPGEFSSCDDLFADKFLRYAVWVIGVLAIIGNVTVFVWRLKTERQNVNSFLILNLSASDFLMGVYLLIIASADQYFESQGRFYQYEQAWREGFVCQFEGFISTIACEMSVFTLVVITVDRVLILVFKFQVNPLSMKTTALVEGVGWTICSVIAAIPLIIYGKKYYGSTSVCLPFTLRNVSSTGWMYSTSVFIAFNLTCFTFIALGYSWIYVYFRQQRLKSKRKSTARDLALARRLILIVLTDFCCWVPISVIGIIALSGVTISRQISAWVAVFIMPINSALNPLLYTFSSANVGVSCRLAPSDRTDVANLRDQTNIRVYSLTASHTVDTTLSTSIKQRRKQHQNKLELHHKKKRTTKHSI